MFTLLAPFAALRRACRWSSRACCCSCANPIERSASVQGTPYTLHHPARRPVGLHVLRRAGARRPGMNIAYWGPDMPDRPAAAGAHGEQRRHVERRLAVVLLRRHPRTVYVLTTFPKQIKVPIPIPLPDLTPLSPPLGRSCRSRSSYKRMNVESHAEARERRLDRPPRRDRDRCPGGSPGRRRRPTSSAGRARSTSCATAASPVPPPRRGAAAPAPPTTASTSVKSVTTTLKPGEAKQRFTLEPQRPSLTLRKGHTMSEGARTGPYLRQVPGRRRAATSTRCRQAASRSPFPT